MHIIATSFMTPYIHTYLLCLQGNSHVDTTKRMHLEFGAKWNIKNRLNRSVHRFFSSKYVTV